LVNHVETAYWDLYFAYRDLESKIAARDAALSTWRRVQALEETDDKAAQAGEQYFRFTEDLQNAISGRIVEGTRSNNGSSGGTFRGSLGVHVAERRLRLLIGLPINDDMMLRPAHDPVPAKVVFDWGEIVREGLVRRAELRKQLLQIKRRELELLASRNFLLPEVDTFGRYRWRGFGKDLLDSDRTGKPRFDNAYRDLTSGDFQEWQLGVEVTMPFGYRRGHAAVRQAQLQLARERAILKEQERQIVHDLSNAISDMRRAYEVSQTAFNRRVAAKKQLASLNEREVLTGRVDLNTMLDAQRRAADADTRYFRALVEYSLAIKNVHFEKGTLLEYNDVYLSDKESIPVPPTHNVAPPVMPSAAEQTLPPPSDRGDDTAGFEPAYGNPANGGYDVANGYDAPAGNAAAYGDVATSVYGAAYEDESSGGYDETNGYDAVGGSEVPYGNEASSVTGAAYRGDTTGGYESAYGTDTYGGYEGNELLPLPSVEQ